MVATQPIAKTITSLDDLKERFNLSPASSDAFFAEWCSDLPSLSAVEEAAIAEIYQRFRRHRDRGTLSEGTVNQLLVAPILTLAGLYDPPFFVTSEPTVMLEVKRDGEILRGRIDTLVLQGQLWVLVVESKDSISFTTALPQALAYMLAKPDQPTPIYGLITSGDEFMFLKLQAGDPPIYDSSDVFYLLHPRRNQLLNVFAILKQIQLAILPSAQI
ncbi:MAG: type I restriction endonuclease subunit R [Alkalinema sp. RU_4_3]|nr:type I restriction endonuclease subunit R [Alkalinema sp. RU_4_3]